MKITLKQMVQAGLHFGHRTQKWNPKMAPYIYRKQDGIHIIDCVKTYFYLQSVSKTLTKLASQGKTFLFIGTKKEATSLVAKTALICESFFVNQRWLGGMLTNWNTMKKSIARLNEFDLPEWQKKWKQLDKKEAAIIKKEKDRLERYLGGLKNMVSIPDVAIIVGQVEEMNAVRECQKLGIRSVTILDTNCDPTLADLFIPANDDSVASLELILTALSEAIKDGRKVFKEKNINGLSQQAKFKKEGFRRTKIFKTRKG